MRMGKKTWGTAKCMRAKRGTKVRSHAGMNSCLAHPAQCHQVDSVSCVSPCPMS